MSRQPSISIVGGGVVGLTTAVLLQDAGHDVQVFAERPGLRSVSGVAAALWHPFRSDPPALVSRWAAATRQHYNRLAAEDPSAGIDLLTLYELRDDRERPWWAADTPDLEPVESGFPGQSRAEPAVMAWRVRAPRAESPVFMAWLERRLRRPVVARRFASLAEVPGDLVVNCTALGSRTLAKDDTLRALYGHVVVCAPGAIDLSVSVSHDAHTDAGSFYVIPRRTEVVIGGVVEPSPDDRPLVPDPATRERILARAHERGFRPGPVLREAVGLRPYRPAVRVQRDPDDHRVVHNYGHGGSGYTLCWGCAEDVVSLLNP
jgi:D-amino-acid oxidase